MRKLFLLLLGLGISLSTFSQNSFKYGLEIQGYPTGIIAGITTDYELSNQLLGHARAGYNLVRHRDLGVHEDERGGGFGGTLGLRYYFSQLYDEWFLEARSDLWFNKITWKDRISQINQTTGKTDVTVLQPTLMGGYTFELGSLSICPTLAFGYEINIKTKGSDVGEGPIILLGVLLNI